MNRAPLLALLLCFPLAAPAADADRMDLPTVEALPVLQLTYVAGGGAPFTVFLAKTPEGATQTRWVFASAGAVEDATFDASRGLGGGVHSFLWVDDADLARGWAVLGHDVAVLTSVEPAGYVFTGRQGVYAFAHVGGYLTSAVGYAGSVVTLVQASLAPSLPPATTQDGTVEYGGPVVDARPTGAPLDEDPSGHAHLALGGGRASGNGDGAAQRVACVGIVRSVLGGDSACAARFTAASPRLDQAHAALPALSTGTVLARVEDAAGVAYYWRECTAAVPKSDATAVTAADCAHAASVAPREGGEHALVGEARFTSCLNPTLLFTCPWQVDVAVVEEG